MGKERISCHFEVVMAIAAATIMQKVGRPPRRERGRRPYEKWSRPRHACQEQFSFSALSRTMESVGETWKKQAGRGYMLLPAGGGRGLHFHWGYIVTATRSQIAG
ncbi:hypothetical protein J6590_078037 [Homalodisca vitripennis]|nr:hypothetical protein J6590_078037 [Homalodisca vitripennis]